MSANADTKMRAEIRDGLQDGKLTLLIGMVVADRLIETLEADNALLNAELRAMTAECARLKGRFARIARIMDEIVDLAEKDRSTLK
jgi:hypothetical protein